MREKVDSHLTAAHKPSKYDYDKRVRDAPVFSSNESEFVDGPLLVVPMNKLRTTDKPTYKKLMAESDGPYRTSFPQQCTLDIHDNVVPSTVSIDQSTHVPSYNKKADVSDCRDAIGGKTAVTESEYQAHKDKVAETEQCDTDETNTLTTPVGIKNIDANCPIECKNSGMKDEKPDIRKPTAKRIVGRTQRNGETHDVVRWYRYTSTEHTAKGAGADSCSF